MESQKIKVYVKVDENKVIKEINSSIFLQETTNYIEIDEGHGDKYAHAQSQYLEKGLMDEKGRYNYKLIDELLEISEEEKLILFPPSPPAPTKEDYVNNYLLDLDYRQTLTELGV